MYKVLININYIRNFRIIILSLGVQVPSLLLRINTIWVQEAFAALVVYIFIDGWFSKLIYGDIVF